MADCFGEIVETHFVVAYVTFVSPRVLLFSAQ